MKYVEKFQVEADTPGSLFPETYNLDIPRGTAEAALEAIFKAEGDHPIYGRVYAFRLNRTVFLDLTEEIDALFADFPENRPAGSTRRLPEGFPTVLSGNEAFGPRYFMPGAQSFTLDQLETLNRGEGTLRSPLDGDEQVPAEGMLTTVISNCRGMSARGAILCRTGNWQPWFDEDVLLGHVAERP